VNVFIERRGGITVVRGSHRAILAWLRAQASVG
jgi:hypothetical protein